MTKNTAIVVHKSEAWSSRWTEAGALFREEWPTQDLGNADTRAATGWIKGKGGNSNGQLRLRPFSRTLPSVNGIWIRFAALGFQSDGSFYFLFFVKVVPFELKNQKCK